MKKSTWPLMTSGIGLPRHVSELDPGHFLEHLAEDVRRTADATRLCTRMANEDRQRVPARDR
jgi:hypothetical protein